MVKAKVLDVDVEKERISLGIKQLGDPIPSKPAAGDHQEGRGRHLRSHRGEDGGIEVKIAGTDMTAFIKRADLARDRNDQRPERFAVGEKVDARVTSSTRRPARSGLDQGAGNRRREGSRGAVRLVRLGRFARRHPRRRPQVKQTSPIREISGQMPVVAAIKPLCQFWKIN
jgi:hypothetical protein